MPFEVFDKRTATSSKTPMVTIQKAGQFSMNKAAHDAMGAPEYVELLYDSDEKLIGFRPASSDNPRAYAITQQGKNTTGKQIPGRAFAKFYDLDVSVARRYPVAMRERVLVLDLKGDSVVVTGPRAAMKSRLGAS